MEITLEILRQFAGRYAQGSVSFIDSTGNTRKLENGEPDAWKLAETANQFWYAGACYGRADFANLIETTTNRCAKLHAELLANQDAMNKLAAKGRLSAEDEESHRLLIQKRSEIVLEREQLGCP
jgi:hypothetical protein